MKFITMLTVSVLLASTTLVSAEEFGSRFNIYGDEMKQICDTDPRACMIWIEGVMEGVELAYRLNQPKEDIEPQQVFCIKKDAKYLEDMRDIFMSYISDPKNAEALDQAAVFGLRDGFEKYACKDE